MKRNILVAVICFLVFGTDFAISCPAVSNWSISPKLQLINKSVQISCTVTPLTNQTINGWTMKELKHLESGTVEGNIIASGGGKPIGLTVTPSASVQFEDAATRSVTIYGNWVDTSDPDYFVGETVSSKFNIVKIEIKQGDNVITDTTHDEIVGKKISLTADVSPKNITITKKQWTIPGTRIANFVGNSTSGTVTSLTVLTNSAIDYYWVDGENGRDVEYAITVDGNELKGKATFNTIKPDSDVQLLGTGIVTTGSYKDGTYIHWGDVNGVPGISISGKLKGSTGLTQWVQVVKSDVIINKIPILENKYLYHKATSLGIDKTYPYDTKQDTNDSPSVSLSSALPDGSVCDRTESFTMWFMFKPQVDSAIYVPLYKMDWDISGTAKKTAGSWSGSGKINTNAFSATNLYPNWNSNAEVYTITSEEK